MRQTFRILLAATAIAGLGLAGPAQARDRTDRADRAERADRADRADMTANQFASLFDARTATMKVDLRLTPEQEKSWPGFESAMRELGRKSADRRVTLRDARAQDKTVPSDFIAQMQTSADSQIERANDWKKLAEAAKPLYAALDEKQRQRFAEDIYRVNRE